MFGVKFIGEKRCRLQIREPRTGHFAGNVFIKACPSEVGKHTERTKVPMKDVHLDFTRPNKILP